MNHNRVFDVFVMLWKRVIIADLNLIKCSVIEKKRKNEKNERKVICKRVEELKMYEEPELDCSSRTTNQIIRIAINNEAIKDYGAKTKEYLFRQLVKFIAQYERKIRRRSIDYWYSG